MGLPAKTKTISAHPSSYDSEHYSWYSITSTQPITNAYEDYDSTTYAQINWTRGSGAETYVYLKFDFSSIPLGATIKAVSVTAKAYLTTTSTANVTTRQMQLAAGTSLKGSALNLTNSSTTSVQTFTNTGTWTREELLDAGLRFYVVRGRSNTNTNYAFRIYGATMTVTYEIQPFKVKFNGSWVIPTKLLVKQSGAWIEASDIKAKSGGSWH